MVVNRAETAAGVTVRDLIENYLKNRSTKYYSIKPKTKNKKLKTQIKNAKNF